MLRAAITCLALCACDSVFGLDPRDAGSGDPSDAPTDGALPDGSGARIQYIDGHSFAVGNAANVNTLTLGQVAQGDLVVVAVATYNASLVRVLDDTGIPYTQPSPAIATTGGASLYLLYRANVAAAAPLQVSAYTSNLVAPEVSMAVHLYRGAAIGPLDQYATTKGDSSAPTSAPLTISEDGELVVAAVVHDSNPTTDGGPSYVLRQLPADDNNGQTPLATEDRAEVPLGPLTATFALSASVPWVLSAMTFRPLPE